MQLQPSTTRGQVGPLVIPEMPSSAIGPRMRLRGDARSCSHLAYESGMSCMLVAYLDGSALTFAALHVVPGPPASTRRKSSGQVPSTHTPQDTLIGLRSGHTWHGMVPSPWLWGRGGAGRGSNKCAWKTRAPDSVSPSQVAEVTVGPRGAPFYPGGPVLSSLFPQH